MKNNDQIIEDILDAIYWVKLSKKEENEIIRILNSEDIETSKANEICEVLNIAKRGNRQSIVSVLIKNK